jgi:hypothetical protein
MPSTVLFPTQDDIEPVRIVAFNTAEGWARDVTEEIAIEIRRKIRST